MKIVMLGAKAIPYPSGIEFVLEKIGPRLIDRGHEIVIYTRRHYAQALTTSYNGMKIIPIPCIRNRNWEALTNTLLAAIVAAKAKPDIVHIHSIGLSLFALITRGCGIPTIVQCHGLDWKREKWGQMMKAYLRLSDFTAIHFPHATTVVSQSLHKYYLDKFRKNTFYIPNGVDAPTKTEPLLITQLGLEAQNYFLFAARLVPEKGCKLLLDAFSKIKSRGKKLVIAGDSNYRDKYYQSLISSAGSDVVFTGFATGRLLDELMTNAYAYILPSTIEGMSTGLLEAMCYGNCVVISDIEENIEVAGEAGLTFTTGSVSDLANKLEYLVHNPNVVVDFKRAASLRASKVPCWDDVALRYESLYLDLLRH